MARKSKAKKRAGKSSQTQPNRAATEHKGSNDAETAPTTPRKARKQETKECSICAETKPVYLDFPILPACDHDPTVCHDCYQKHFQVRIEVNRDLGWNACNCPLCGQNITKAQAQGILRRPISKEFDKLITKMTDQIALNFLWCPAGGCGHGECHNLTNTPWVRCSNCKAKICFQHQRLWHEGLTCEDYDNMANQEQAAQIDYEFIRTTTKSCPRCGRRIIKEGGCNHMDCPSCRWQWFWNEVPFDGETIATEAEILGQPGGAPPLVGEQRQCVGQAMATVNAQIERDNAARQEAARQEAARQEAARREAVRFEAHRQDSIRLEALRQEFVNNYNSGWFLNVATQQAGIARRHGRDPFDQRGIQKIQMAIMHMYRPLRPFHPHLVDLTKDRPLLNDASTGDRRIVEMMAEAARRVALNIDEVEQLASVRNVTLGTDEPQQMGPEATAVQQDERNIEELAEHTRSAALSTVHEPHYVRPEIPAVQQYQRTIEGIAEHARFVALSAVHGPHYVQPEATSVVPDGPSWADRVVGPDTGNPIDPTTEETED